MKENFIPYELAKKLEEKGFPMPTNVFYAAYDDEKTICLKKIQWNTPEIESIAPSIEQVLKWLRDSLRISLEMFISGYFWACLIVDLTERDEDCDLFYLCIECVKGEYKSYEEAAIAGITYVVDNLL